MMELSTAEKVVMNLYEVLKVMKSAMDDMVVINGNRIIFVSCGSKLSVLELIYDTGIHIGCRFSDIEAFCNKKYDCSFLRYNYDIPMYYSVLDIYNRHVINLNNPIVVNQQFLVDFPEIAKMKADEPYKVLNVGGVLIMMIPGIINTAKGDTVSLSIYDNGNTTYTIKFDVYRKKIKNTIHIYLVQFKL